MEEETERIGRRSRRRLLVSICVLAAVCGSITHAAVLPNDAHAITSRTHLPHVSREWALPRPAATLTATQTSAPTGTPTATLTGPTTPTPTTVSQQVRILSDHSSYVDSVDYLHIVGEVQNDTASHLRFVRIVANVFDSSGRLLDTGFTYTHLGILPAGNRTCFHVLLPKPEGWSYFEFEAPTYWPDGEPLPTLTVMNDSGAYEPILGSYEIIGLVRNDHGTRVDYVSPVGTAYNASGTVVGCDFTYVNSTHLDPGQISSFKLLFFGRDYSDVASYRLQVDGEPR